MSDPFFIPEREKPKFASYAWLDLKQREWDNVKFLPNGWKRVPFERHADRFAGKETNGFIEVDGLTLCTQNIANEQRKQGLDWNTASDIAADYEQEFAGHMRQLGLIPVQDAAGLQPMPGDEVLTTRKK